MYPLFTSLIPLSKNYQEIYKFFPAEFALNTCNINSQKKNSVKSSQCLALKHYSDNAMLHFELSHNALAQWRKVITSSLLEPLLHHCIIICQILSRYRF